MKYFLYIKIKNMTNKINIDFNKNKELSYCDKNIQFNNDGVCDFKKESKTNKWIVYLNKKIDSHSKGAIVIAETINGKILYYDDFEKYIKKEFRY